MKYYEQIVADIKRNIQNNKYKPGDKLPSLMIMANQYQVSKGTVLKAYETLEKQCLIFSKPQSGYYIADGIRIQSNNHEGYHLETGNPLVNSHLFNEMKQCLNIAAELYYGWKLPFTWYIIGNYNTDDGDKLWENIKKYRVEHVVKPIGARRNPYAYMANCNLYVCLSISEACPFVINEASILHLPIACTDFPSAREFIKPGFNGVIVPFESLPEKIASLISNKKEYSELFENVKNYTYGNKFIKKELKALFEL